MGRLIAQTGDEELLASRLLACEAQIALWANTEWWAHFEMLDTETNFFCHQMGGPEHEEAQRALAELDEYRMVAHHYMSQLLDDKDSAQTTLRQVMEISKELGLLHGTSDLVARYDGSRELPPSPLLPIPGLMKRLRKDRARVHAVAKAGRAELSALEALGTERLDFGRRLDSRYLAWHVDKKSPRQFEYFVADLLKKEGQRVERSHGGPTDDAADVIAVLDDGRRAVFQCKHSTKGNTVDRRHLQAVNGTARQVHRADLAIVVTNGFFTAPGARFAYDHGIDLLDRERLRRWATGEPLQSVLDQPHLGSATAA